MKKVLLVELSVFERMTPLVSGYLQAYAMTDSVIRSAYRFERYTAVAKADRADIIRDLVRSAADVYAFSCYVWNMGLVKAAVEAVRQARPQAHIILGGPQVMSQALRYLSENDERTVICNGEGEITFTQYLLALTESSPRFHEVNGLSFYRDRELVTTPKQPRISSLDEVPSPFLTGVFDSAYSIAILETNRGCPYHCGFCFWGAATNDRVHRFDEDRVREEIKWIAKNEILFLFIADANWGMLGRDVDISQHITDCANEHGAPNVVYFSAAKNKPQAVTKITGIFQDANLIASQPVSLQTLEPTSLDLISRSNIKLSAFAAIQEDLREKRISSYVELIWPLPGETLDSFKRGIGTLCENEAQTVIAYPHLLLNNTPIYHQAETMGILSRPAGGGAAEAQVVIGTKEVSEEEFVEGMYYFYAFHALHNTRSLRTVSRYLVKQSGMEYQAIFSAFSDFLRRQGEDDPVLSYMERSIREADYYDVNNYGLFIHTVLHEHRERFADHVRRFAQSQDWWDDSKARALFEIDLLNRPYMYSNTPMDVHPEGFQALELLDRGPRSYTVRVPSEYLTDLADAVPIQTVPADGTFMVDHKRLQYPFMPTQSRDHSGSYCHGMIEKVGNVMPFWLPASARQSSGEKGLDVHVAI
ncbi:cobalamin-dependent protein [Streptomyces cellulosae]|uniref:cobalamin-dependent protein n=1 Tax=Streptomyces cellulosae TaxID=1968 RepID=UPI0004CBF0E4|nr:cobalamin-dependent protein [Streptomyces cellulosae]